MHSKELDKKLKNKNIKPTAMRQMVLKVLIEENKALSLPELEQKLFPADKSTLYRTLKKFEENKLIHRVDDGSGAVKYAVCSDTCTCSIDDLHAHFYCVKCGQTYCLHEISIPNFNLPKGFTLESAEIVIKGVCANCNLK